MAEENLETKEFEVVESSQTEQTKAENEKKELLKRPEIRANIVFQNYINTCGRVLTGQEKRTLRRKIYRETLKGRYDYLFDEEKMQARINKSEKAFDALNKN